MNLCVFGASSNRVKKSYFAKVEELGEAMAKRGHTLVFGAGATGMMGAAARSVKRAGGRVVGIAPSFFQVPGVLFEECDEMVYTDTMHERKELLRSRSDGFIITPGGIGTYDEFFEVLTLLQLGVLDKPLTIFNPENCFAPLLELLNQTIEGGFMAEECRRLWHVESDAQALLSYLEEEGEKRKTSGNRPSDLQTPFLYLPEEDGTSNIKKV